MKIEDGIRTYYFGVLQGTPEWSDLRKGKPTSSKLNEVLGSGEGHKRYLRQLAGERITGLAEETFKNDHMRNGNKYEHLARSTYTAYTGNSVQMITFIDLGSWGSSPDGLVGDDGLVEIKVRIPSVHIETIETNRVPSENRKQVHGNLLAADRKWCDYVSFCFGMRPHIIRVFRDPEMDSLIEAGIKSFNNELTELLNLLENKK